jgi:predicted transcriptional regulator/DNA-binding XRE family transcriptional regulator
VAERKIFAGARIRRIRNERALTQVAMAENLGISPSYLNLIERNQRPLTVQLLLKLASVYKVDLDQLQEETGSVLAGLKEVFSEPLLAGELPCDQELIDICEAAPNAAAGVLKLFRAYREQQKRLTDLSDMMAREGKALTLSPTRLPLDEVREVLARRPHYFERIEAEADSFNRLLKSEDGLTVALKQWLKREQSITVRTLPAATMPNWRRRYDRHSLRLFISERLSVFDQTCEIAMEAVSIRMQVVIGAELEDLKLSTAEAKRIARFELLRYAAHALMMPYTPFREAAQRAKYDLDVLRARFNVSFEQAACRLTTLQKHGASGIAFFLQEIDQAGNRLRHFGAQGFPQARFGGSCPKLQIYNAFSHPQQVLAEQVELPDKAQYLTISRTVEGAQTGFGEQPRRTALMLGCEATYAQDTVYASYLAGVSSGGAVSPVGTACRLCERQACLARAEPPLTRPLALDETVSGFSAYDFQ